MLSTTELDCHGRTTQQISICICSSRPLPAVLARSVAQARNFLRDRLKRGDLAFFYHSSCKEPGIAGMVEVHTAHGFLVSELCCACMSCERELLLAQCCLEMVRLSACYGSQNLCHALAYAQVVKEGYPDETQFDPKSKWPPQTQLPLPAFVQSLGYPI